MESDWLDDFYLFKLKKNRVALVRDIIPDPIMDHLLAEDIVSQEEYEQVMYCNQTTAGRNRKLLDIISTKGPNGYNELRNVLLVDFKWLAEILDNTPRPANQVKPEVNDECNMTPDTSAVLDSDIDEVVRSLLSIGSLMSWKFLARKLNITEDKVTEIEYRSARDLRGQIYEMLLYWRLSNGCRATVDWLCKALHDEGRLATVEAIRINHRA